jgi:hypothetical protein
MRGGGGDAGPSGRQEAGDGGDNPRHGGEDRGGGGEGPQDDGREEETSATCPGWQQRLTCPRSNLVVTLKRLCWNRCIQNIATRLRSRFFLS